MTPIAPHITAYLRERLPNERNASPHTSDGSKQQPFHSKRTFGRH